MQAPENLLGITPVLPSSDISRDVDWYEKMTGFTCLYADRMYAILLREQQCIHLQWHAGTSGDPMPEGSVVRIFVKDIQPLVEEFIRRGTIRKQSYIPNTPWNTREFGFHDLNRNSIYMVEDLD